ncbi:putative P2X purinoceptor 7 isoform X1 [Apostichopus japonicus]|uniref:Putative P2X purinoceptor 7 isoform X1 n=1 Tax=Stichopus japonicus TaxID=307972 RepID=A0A2G8KBH6_STIJA|nr:putative P2X purinoceptor 7 isoform X1 [Apostichopus japonicus]
MTENPRQPSFLSAVLVVGIICVLMSLDCSLSEMSPVFVGCEENVNCTMKAGMTGTLKCDVIDVTQTASLSMTATSANMNIYYQRETIVTSEGVTNISLISNYTITSSSCGSPFKVVCSLNGQRELISAIGVPLTKAELFMVPPCVQERSLTLEAKVGLVAFTLFPFLWIFTLITVLHMNKKTIPVFLGCKASSSPKSKEYYLLRPRRLANLDEENHRKELYIYFVDEKCCIAIAEVKPKRSIQLTLETLIPPLTQFIPADSESVLQLRNSRRTIDETVTINNQTYSFVSSNDTLHQYDEIKSEDVVSIEDETKLPEAERSGASNVDYRRKSSAKLSNSNLIERTPKWCRCGSCPETNSHLEQLCCRRSHGVCITNDTLFEQLVTDMNTLKAAISQWYGPEYQKDFTSRLYRRIAYNEYVHWQLGHGQRSNRVIVPACVVKSVRLKYPDVEYTGFVIPRV